MTKKSKVQNLKFNKDLQFIVGFTLLELLIVMTVIGALAGVVLMGFGPASQQRARDTIRRSDIKQYQTALEIYANKNNSYPGGATMPCGDLNLTGSACKTDPSTGASYSYNVSGADYAIGATLEYQPAGTQRYFIACSNGLSGDSDSAPGLPCPL